MTAAAVLPIPTRATVEPLRTLDGRAVERIALTGPLFAASPVAAMPLVFERRDESALLAVNAHVVRGDATVAALDGWSRAQLRAGRVYADLMADELA